MLVAIQVTIIRMSRNAVIVSDPSLHGFHLHVSLAIEACLLWVLPSIECASHINGMSPVALTSRSAALTGLQFNWPSSVAR